VECPIFCILQATADQNNTLMHGKVWQLTVGCPRHNHDPSTSLFAHPALRKIEKDKAFKATIKA
jgi:hypothetical protein